MEAEDEFLDAIDEDASMSARRMMTPGLTDGEFALDERQ
jgi:hypothetical protein